jgi:hypothetical protein
LGCKIAGWQDCWLGCKIAGCCVAGYRMLVCSLKIISERTSSKTIISAAEEGVSEISSQQFHSPETNNPAIR